MIVTMYDVNLGEAIIYEEGFNKLLVDCGAKFGSKGDLAFSRVQTKISGGNTKLLITHFDEDHFNGICKMPKTIQFDEIYLPLYIWKKGNLKDALEVFVDIIKSWAYITVVGKTKKINKLQELFMKIPELVNSPIKIKCVGFGDEIYSGTQKFEVLWPNYKDNNRKTMQYTNELINIIERIIKDTDYSIDEINRVVNSYFNSFMDMYTFYVDNRNIVDDSLSGDESIKRQEKHRILHAELENKYEELIELQLKITISERDKKRIDSISSTQIKNMNECSIVLQQEKNILALGDISNKVLKYLKKCKRISDSYKFIKIAHHGTKSYYSKDLPKAKKYFVSNSGEWRKDWSIYKEYHDKYYEKMYCTNNSDRCDAIKCDCRNCNVIKKLSSQALDLSTV